MKLKKSRVAFLTALLVAGLFSCARDYVTGKRTFSLVSEADEIAMGRASDPQIISEFGLYDDPKLAAYVDSIGQAIARVSQRPNLKYTFRVVDSPVVNAFALPGGWVYFTRGILAHFNSEAELAGVMGHEIGHVVARHGAEQMSRAQLANLGLGLGSVLSADFAKYSRLAQTGLSILFLSFSRGQESESDLLGVEYSTKLGYNANEMANFFKTIAKMSAGGESVPSFLSTHPNPADREATVHRLANEWQKKINYQPKRLRKIDYLRHIDGIIYGEDPRQGFVEGNMFYHPQMRFQFPIPAGWQLTNSPVVVHMLDPDKKAAIQFAAGKGSTLAEAADQFVNSTKAQVLKKQNVQIHGMPGLMLESQISAQEQALQIRSYFINFNKTVFVFHGYTSPADYPKYVARFDATAKGFDRLRNKKALQKKPLRVRIRKVNKSGDLTKVLKGFGMKQDWLDQLALMNGMELTDRVGAGEYIKILGY